MRLLDTKTLELVDFPHGNVPSYAILSHTWSDGEVTFQDMERFLQIRMKGYNKIVQTCRLARAQGYKYAWVDSCCIDKSSSAELSEAVNSMFKWYSNAEVCYVYFVDLLPYVSLEVGLPLCRWFTRGFTLQELIAPRVVQFYDSEWNYRGVKSESIDIISKITRISPDVLKSPPLASKESIATRMSWAAHRQTTRLEDIAYCLLGILEVNMPLLYGEGSRAFRRLQEEIIKRNNDLTIFAWDVPQTVTQQFIGLFAASPAAFARSVNVVPFHDDYADFSVTNKGLLLKGDVPLSTAILNEGTPDEVELYILHLGYIPTSRAVELWKAHGDINSWIATRQNGGIFLRKIGPGMFCRDAQAPIAGFGKPIRHNGNGSLFDEAYLLLDPDENIAQAALSYRENELHVALELPHRLIKAVPNNLFDHTSGIFLKSNLYHWAKHTKVLAIQASIQIAESNVNIVVLCDSRGRQPAFKLFRQESQSSKIAIMFEEHYRELGISWPELLGTVPEIEALSNVIIITKKSSSYRISASYHEKQVETMSADVSVLSLALECEELKENTGDNPGKAQHIIVDLPGYTRRKKLDVVR